MAKKKKKIKGSQNPRNPIMKLDHGPLWLEYPARLRHGLGRNNIVHSHSKRDTIQL